MTTEQSFVEKSGQRILNVTDLMAEIGAELSWQHKTAIIDFFESMGDITRTNLKKDIDSWDEVVEDYCDEVDSDNLTAEDIQKEWV